MSACRIALPGGLVALVSEQDFGRTSARRWHVIRGRSGLRYAMTTWRRGPGLKQAGLYLHRFVACALPGQVIDHRDGDGLNCTRENLRYCTVTDNCRNRTNNRSAFKGVTRGNGTGVWRAYIYAGELKADGSRKRVDLGTFSDSVAAARAYDMAAVAAFGEFAKLNFPLPAGDE
jgi:hypothetical protein